MAVAIKVHDQPTKDLEEQTTKTLEIEEAFDYSKRSQWLRASVLGANDGLLSTAALMMGVGAVKKDNKTMILTEIAGLVAGACSMAIGEFVSVYSQYDTEMQQIKRESLHGNITKAELEVKKKKVPSPLKAATASTFMFAIGAVVPLLAAAFVMDSCEVDGCNRSIGGWLAMGITFGLTKLVGSGL
ncbi:vacuolar iron transporter-like [Heracleum sosnowskyi]|uniref:Vacuolar iron transporter n=1 Tax=Heracleum sosnowskyi TaxID=360622 RepID=A0AAD8IQ08_9APIA|nr:vacuolar iron transporter-like [Heracleum sosnowskyi]